MSYVPAVNYYGMLSDIGDTLTKGLQDSANRSEADKLIALAFPQGYGQPASNVAPAAITLSTLGNQGQTATGVGNGVQAPAAYLPFYQKASAETGIPVPVLMAQHYQESRFDPNATGKAGEIGIGQILPSTARDPGFGIAPVNPAALRDPETNIMFSARYLAARAKALGQNNWANPASALAAYNGGGDPNYVQNVSRYLPSGGGVQVASSDPNFAPAMNGGAPMPPVRPDDVGLPRSVVPVGGRQAPQGDGGDEDTPTAPVQVAQNAGGAPISIPPQVGATRPQLSMQVISRMMQNPYTRSIGAVLLQQQLAAQTGKVDYQQFGNTIYAKGADGSLRPVGNIPKDPVLQDIPVNDANGNYVGTQKQWVMPGQTTGTPVGAVNTGKDNYQINTQPDGSLLAINKADPTDTRVIQTGAKPKDRQEFDIRSQLADQLGLQGDARTTYIANGRLDNSHVLKRGDVAISGTGATIAKNDSTTGDLSDQAADFLAERVLAGDKQALVGLGRGAQGADNLSKINALVSEKAQARGINASDMLNNQAVQQGLVAQQRTLGNQTARMSTSSVEAQGAIMLGRQASDAVPRGNWVPINRAIQMYQNNTGDPALAKFGAANLAIINTYARAINPNGQPTIADKDHASALLSTAMGPDQYNAVLDQLQNEINMAHNSPGIAKKGLENIRKGKAFMDGIDPNSVMGSDGATPQGGNAKGGTTKSGVKWSIE